MAVSTLGWLLSGVLLGGLLIGLARRLRWRDQVRFFAACWSLRARSTWSSARCHGPRWTALEAMGFLLYSALALAGLRRPRLLALGWLLHVARGTGLHLALDQPVIGSWLPLACLPFDCMVAAYLAYAERRQRAA